jgi:hypothetical protein
MTKNRLGHITLPFVATLMVLLIVERRVRKLGMLGPGYFMQMEVEESNFSR